MNAPKISVVIATFNRAAMLKEALQSLVDQTFSDFEAIIVDDGSTDETPEIVAAFSDPRFHYIFQENKGRSTARNCALAKVRSTFIAFLDSDDLFAPDKLYRQLTALENNPDYAMSYTSASIIDDTGCSQNTCYRALESGQLHDKIAFYLPVTILLPTVMVRSSILNDSGWFDEQMNRFEDTDLWRRISLRSRLLAIDEPLTSIRNHAGNQMEHPLHVYEAVRYYTGKIKSDADTDVEMWHSGSARLFLHYGLAIYQMAGMKPFSYPFFFESIKLSPDKTINTLQTNQVLGVPQALRLLLCSFIVAPLKLSKFFVVTIIDRIVFRLRRCL